MRHLVQKWSTLPEEIAEKLATLNAIHALCKERCIPHCNPDVREPHMSLRLWFEERNIPIMLEQNQYVIESPVEE